MTITIGSKNATKVEAVAETLKGYPKFKDAEVVPLEVNIDKYGHPKSLEEVVAGAMNRARQAFQDCAYSFGIEGGLMEFPHTKTGFMEMTVCAIYDGKEYHLGTAPGFEWPKEVIQGITEKGLDGSQALREMGLTEAEKIGAENGGIWHLTNGRMDRKEYNKTAVMMALIHLEHPEYYR